MCGRLRDEQPSKHCFIARGGEGTKIDFLHPKSFENLFDQDKKHFFDFYRLSNIQCILFIKHCISRVVCGKTSGLRRVSRLQERPMDTYTSCLLVDVPKRIQTRISSIHILYPTHKIPSRKHSQTVVKLCTFNLCT